MPHGGGDGNGMSEITFNGPAGRLEAKFHHGPDRDSPVALVLHPHPQHGGTMNNKVVHTVYRSFARLGFSTLRFNFRGVGHSEGVYDQGEGELTDAAAALDWLQATFPASPSYWVAGFSFGAWIAMQLLMRRPELEGFVAVSPPANLYDFTFLAPCPVSGLVVQGDADTIVVPASVENLVQKLRNQKGIAIGYESIPEADHFFTNQLDQLSESVEDYIQKRMGYAERDWAISA